jgi:serine/threonine protein kinase
VSAGVGDNEEGILVQELLTRNLLDVIYFPAKHDIGWTEKLKRDMALQIAQGMAYLHTTSPCVAHGDLKPTNVILTDRNDCRIVDFGLSAIKKSSRQFSFGPDCTGSLYYQAPEVLKTGASVKRDHTVDLYAFAVILLELFQEQSPFAANMSAFDIDALVKHGGCPNVDRTRVPADVAAIVSTAWHQNKDERSSFTTIVTRLMSWTGVCAGSGGCSCQ